MPAAPRPLPLDVLCPRMGLSGPCIWRAWGKPLMSEKNSPSLGLKDTSKREIIFHRYGYLTKYTFCNKYWEKAWYFRRYNIFTDYAFISKLSSQNNLSQTLRYEHDFFPRNFFKKMEFSIIICHILGVTILSHLHPTCMGVLYFAYHETFHWQNWVY